VTAGTVALAALTQLSPEARKHLLERLQADVREYDARHRFELIYPETGPLRRELYNKHMEFFAAGAEHQERAFIAGNRTGKTTAASFEMTCHLAGKYPQWWIGRRFNRPIVAWAAGEDAKQVRESVQAALFGEIGSDGTRMIPADLVISKTRRPGVPEAIDSALIRHVSGGQSRVVLKSYDQRREAFQGAKIDVGWADEEPPVGIYSEFLTRTMATVPGEKNGLLVCTFTPLKGLSGVVLLYLPVGRPQL
jgi:phage terminase large subunit-like protein